MVSIIVHPFSRPNVVALEGMRLKLKAVSTCGKVHLTEFKDNRFHQWEFNLLTGLLHPPKHREVAGVCKGTDDLQRLVTKLLSPRSLAKEIFQGLQSAGVDMTGLNLKGAFLGGWSFNPTFYEFTRRINKNRLIEGNDYKWCQMTTAEELTSMGGLDGINTSGDTKESEMTWQ